MQDIRFVFSVQDEIALRFSSFLKNGALILQDGERVATSEALLNVGIFSTSQENGIKRGCFSRTASHRVMSDSPKWTKDCQMLIAVKSGEEVEPKKAQHIVDNWVFIANTLAHGVLWEKKAPWGELPSTADKFQLYTEWLEKHMGLDTATLGIKFVPKRISRDEVKELSSLMTQIELVTPKRFTDTVVQAIQITPHTQKLPSLSDVAAWSLRLHKELSPGSFSCESNAQLQNILRCVWRAGLEQKPIQVITPLCPAWSHNDGGYTFRGLEDTAGICYEMMMPTLEKFCQAMARTGVETKLFVWVADIEWFDIDNFPATQGTISREDFFSKIDLQCQLIRSDLARKGIPAEVCRFMSGVTTEQNYLESAASTRADFLRMLRQSWYVKDYFQHLLEAEQMLYGRQCLERVDVDNPSEKVLEALVGDIVCHLAPQKLILEKFTGENLLYFLQAGPFAQLYKDMPYVVWHTRRKGAF